MPHTPPLLTEAELRERIARKAWYPLIPPQYRSDPESADPKVFVVPGYLPEHLAVPGPRLGECDDETG